MSQMHFGGRPWCYLKKVEGTELDEVFEWTDLQEMDCLCMGVVRGTFDNPEDPDWRSIWSFGTEAELALFAIRFGVDRH